MILMHLRFTYRIWGCFDFKGGMVENYVNVQLTINGYHTYYWESRRGAEIDFVIQRETVSLFPLRLNLPIIPGPRA